MRQFGRSLGTMAALTIVTLATHANAMPLSYEVVFAGSTDSPVITIQNLSVPGAEITGFSLTIGDTAFNFDMVWAQSTLIDTGAALSATLDSPDGVPNAVRSDVISFSGITGFDKDDKFFFKTDIDPDSVNGLADYRTVLTNNGGDNAVISVDFLKGTATTTLDVEVTGGIDDYKFVLMAGGGFSSTTPVSPPAGPNPNPIPEPTSMALFGLGLAGLGIVSRRRRLAHVT